MPASPKARHIRARIAGTRSRHPEADVTDLQREYRTARAEEYIAELLATAPPLTVEQRERLATLLSPYAGDAS